MGESIDPIKVFLEEKAKILNSKDLDIAIMHCNEPEQKALSILRSELKEVFFLFKVLDLKINKLQREDNQ